MFTRNRQNESNLLEPAMTEVRAKMAASIEDTETYLKYLDILTKLETLSAEKQPKRISKDTMALIIGNIAGILIVVSYEHAHVVASRAMNFVLKAR